MSVSIIKLDNNNLLDNAYWTVGTGPVYGYDVNGGYTESQRLYDTGPYGQSVIVWQSNPASDGGPSGGWEGSYFTIDSTKTYRFSVWVRRTSASTGGTFYMGCHTNGGGDTYQLNGGGSNTNPYWHITSPQNFNQNQWYLVVGHLFPNSYAGWAHQDSGVYTQDGGKVSALTGNTAFDIRMGSSTTKAMSRVYHYYTSNTADHLQFYAPRVEPLTSLTPPIDTLLQTDLSNKNSYAFGLQMADGTIKANNISQNGKLGQLIQVDTFTSSGTWTKPSGATNVLVQMVGGGGGAAYHQESGGAGGFAEKLINVSGVSSVAVTIGGGGSRVAYYAAAGNGGTSSFGSYCSASGGYGANQNSSHTGGVGGVGSSGNINANGGTGSGHANSSGHYPGATGGGTYFGGSSCVYRDGVTTKMINGAPGSGGPGGRTNDGSTGGYGESGIVIVYSYS